MGSLLALLLPLHEHRQTRQRKRIHGGGVPRAPTELRNQEQTNYNKNPTVQSIVERLHLTIGDQLHTSPYEGDNRKEDVDMLLQACAWAIRTTTPSNTPHSPGQLIFGIDMIFCQKVKIDWALLKKQRRDQALANNQKKTGHAAPTRTRSVTSYSSWTRHANEHGQ
ncbi:hypothetical protein ACHAW6_004297, partial [Cyclotella cf. meneghiniana]